MSVYAGESPPFLDQCLDSIAASSLVPDEVVLVCDGPLNDAHEFIIEKHASRLPLTLIHLEKNSGLSGALNAGLSHCHHEWVARMDTDDICQPDRFLQQLSYIQNHPDIDILGGTIEEYNADLSIKLGSRQTPEDHQALVVYAKKRNPFNHMTVMFRKAMVEKVGGYPHLYQKEDYGLWIKAIHSGARLANCNQVLVKVRAGETMLKRRSGLKYAAAEIPLQKLMVVCGMKSPMEAIVDGLLRASVFLSPISIRRLVYQNRLRNRR